MEGGGCRASTVALFFLFQKTVQNDIFVINWISQGSGFSKLNYINPLKVSVDLLHQVSSGFSDR